MKYSRIFGLDVACIEKHALLEQVSTWVAAPRSDTEQMRTLSYVNAHCLNVAWRNRAYYEHLRSFDLVYPDGIGVVWAGRWLDGSHLYKLTGADWISAFCDLAQSSRWRLSILAGEPGVADKARVNLLQAFPDLQILNARDGFFSEMDEPEVIAEITATQPDVLFVGMGVPLQEAWISRWKSTLPVKVCWAVGALFDYVAGIEPRAPVWMRANGFEWLWRMMMDPSGKWKRYLLGNPLFFARVVQQKFHLER